MCPVYTSMQGVPISVWYYNVGSGLVLTKLTSVCLSVIPVALLLYFIGRLPQRSFVFFFPRRILIRRPVVSPVIQTRSVHLQLHTTIVFMWKLYKNTIFIIPYNLIKVNIYTRLTARPSTSRRAYFKTVRKVFWILCRVILILPCIYSYSFLYIVAS